MEHKIRIKVYYEDTDAAGVVYYANYLRYFERARTELFAQHGIDVAEYHNMGYFFPITHVDIYYKRPARLGDILEITADIKELKKASITLRQCVFKGETILVESFVTVACIDKNGRPRRLPEIFRGLSKQTPQQKATGFMFN